jgi:hypothetical protein
MCAGAARDFTEEVPGGYGIGRRAAYAFGRLGRDSAWPHMANSAANAAFAEAALVFLSVRTLKAGFNAISLAFFKHGRRSAIAYP